jgi:hypothetical protein
MSYIAMLAKTLAVRALRHRPHGVGNLGLNLRAMRKRVLESAFEWLYSLVIPPHAPLQLAVDIAQRDKSRLLGGLNSLAARREHRVHIASNAPRLSHKHFV